MATTSTLDQIDIAEKLIAQFQTAKPVNLDAPERTDFALYYEAVLGWYMPSHMLVSLDKIIDRSLPSLLVLWPPGHGKTMLLATLAAWLLGNDPNLRIMIVTHTTTYSQRVLDMVTTLLAHPISKRVFGNLIPPKSARSRWTQDQRTILRSDYRLKDPSLLALGVGSNTPGPRCDVILADDMVTQTNSMSPTMRKHISAWFWGSLEKRLDPGGMMRISGARFYAQDLYGELISKGMEKIVLTTTPENPLWPERYGVAEIKRYMEMDYFSYVAQCCQRPVDLESGFLRDSWLSYYIDAPPDLRIYQGVDPCVSDRPSTDPLAIVTIGVDRNNTVYLLDIFKGQATLDQHRDIIVARAATWNPILIGIETNSAQELIAQHILSTNALPLVQIQTQLSKPMRFSAMATHFRNKKVLLPAVMAPGGFVQPHPFKALPFVQEWRGYSSTSKQDHILDACEHALNVALRLSVKAGSSTSSSKPLSLGRRNKDSAILDRRWDNESERTYSLFAH